MLGSIQRRSDKRVRTRAKKAAKFANHSRDSVWENLAQRSKTARILALFKAYAGERACKAIGDRLQGSCYLSRDDHDWKISARKQRTRTGKYSFVNTNIQLWNQPPAEALENFPYRSYIFKKNVRKLIASEVKCSVVKWSEVKWIWKVMIKPLREVKNGEWWEVKWIEDLRWNVCIIVELCTLYVGYCIVCLLLSHCLISICFMCSALCYVLINCCMFLIYFLSLFFVSYIMLSTLCVL